MNEMRKAFEAWAVNGGGFACVPDKDDAGQYSEPEAHYAWLAWQAATKAEREACAKLCDAARGVMMQEGDDAEDEDIAAGGFVALSMIADAIRSRTE